MSRKYFGTDGVRGLVGTSPITPDFVMRLGYAAGLVLAHDEEAKAAVATYGDAAAALLGLADYVIKRNH